MKIQILNYTFDKTAKTVTFLDYPYGIRLDGLLLITNVTTNTIIYNFADSAKGGTISDNVLTLTYNTSAMANTDKLQIFYQDEAEQTDLSILIKILLEAIVNPPTTDKSLNQIRTAPQSLPTLANVTTCGTVTTVGTVSTITNVPIIDGIQGRILMNGMNAAGWGHTVRSLLT